MGRRNKPAGTQIPAWMPTFADMMTLLMAFFVLLLSLAEINAEKYRAVAGELKRALGVEVDSKVITLPDGTLDKLLEVADKKTEPAPPAACEVDNKERDKKLEQLYDLVKTRLTKMTADHELFVQQVDKQIIIRIQEQGVFPSGSDKIQPEFLPKVEMLRDLLAELDSGVRVTGHTDDVPIHNGRYRSNWELSAARAVSVVHELLKDGKIDVSRLSAVGYGESRPLVPNTSNENRTRNRRVDIVLTADTDPLPSELPGPPGERASDGAEVPFMLRDATPPVPLLIVDEPAPAPEPAQDPAQP